MKRPGSPRPRWPGPLTTRRLPPGLAVLAQRSIRRQAAANLRMRDRKRWERHHLVCLITILRGFRLHRGQSPGGKPSSLVGQWCHAALLLLALASFSFRRTLAAGPGGLCDPIEA